MRLTDNQMTALVKITATCGGGASSYDFHPQVVNALARRNLVQVKSGSTFIVHTPEGLALLRALKPDPLKFGLHRRQIEALCRILNIPKPEPYVTYG
jgi:hypothetical protein